MTSLPAGQRAPSISAKVIMASTAFVKGKGCTGALRLFLLGLLLPSVLVSGQSSTTVDGGMSGMNGTTTTWSNSTSMDMIYCPSFMCNYSDCYTMYNSQNATACPADCYCQLFQHKDRCYIASCVASCADICVNTSQINCSVNCCNSTGCLNGTFASMMMTTTTGAPPTTAPTTMQSSIPMSTSGSTSSSSSMTSILGSSTSMNSITQTSNSTSGMSGMNGTTTTWSNSTSMDMIYCPSFMCNYSDCYTMYNSQNATSCPADCYCQLFQHEDRRYIASCVASCADICVNTSQINCSVNCCNSTGCLNGTFASMMMTTTTVMAETTMMMTTTTMATSTAPPAPATTSASPTTTADNGKKCHQGTCTGETCYTTFETLQTCSSTQPHCQLKKETEGSNTKWTAGCTTNCSNEIPCRVNTQPPCHLECCNSTVTSSCLFRNGTLNVPNFATRGPHLDTEVMAALLCLLAVTVLL